MLTLSIIKYTTLFTLLFVIISMNGCSLMPPLTYSSQPREEAGFWIGDIGPTGPLFSGPPQFPFICTSLTEGLGQPLIDNHAGRGNAVFRETWLGPWIFGAPVGYSENCSIATRVDYFYFSRAKQAFVLLKRRDAVSDDVERITLADGREVDFIVRAERGTINRFLYSIAMLAPFAEQLDSPQQLDNSAWNRKLLYKFQGGVGIGHWQGRMRMEKKHALYYEALRRGYAVAFSSGSSTDTHYNLTLAEETALLLKQHFAATYGAPLHTIGLGGSGGAILQYLLAQNRPGLIDGAIAQLSYPDMVTQISYVADCDLLERYFDEQYRQMPDSKWGDWSFRQTIQGVGSSTRALESSKHANPYAPAPGANTCTRGWRGHVQNVMNPYWAHPAYGKALELFRYPDAVKQQTKWNYWNDLANIYPQDEAGFGKSSWDNVGVQYGLVALRRGELSVDEFLELNSCVGSWKPASEMRLGDYPWNPGGDEKHPDPWDAANMNLSAECKHGTPAPRSAASVDAIAAAFDSGQVFKGKIDIPVIDVRWYLDPALDIHHLLGSFAARARIDVYNGSHDNQIIWVAECDDIDAETLERKCSYDPSAAALDVMEEWLTHGKPAAAVDSCFDHDGRLIDSGSEVWGGVLDDKLTGACTLRFPIHATARQMAGEGIAGNVLKCDLKPVEQALNDGAYGSVQFTPPQMQRLQQIFVDGVCSYRDQ